MFTVHVVTERIRSVFTGILSLNYSTNSLESQTQHLSIACSVLRHNFFRGIRNYMYRYSKINLFPWWTKKWKVKKPKKFTLNFSSLQQPITCFVLIRKFFEMSMFPSSHQDCRSSYHYYYCNFFFFNFNHWLHSNIEWFHIKLITPPTRIHVWSTYSSARI